MTETEMLNVILSKQIKNLEDLGCVVNRRDLTFDYTELDIKFCKEWHEKFPGFNKMVRSEVD